MLVEHMLKAVAFTIAASVPFAVAAQTYPVKAVRIIVPFPPGSGVDIAVRLVAPKLTEALGQQFVADNRPGAGGNIGAELAARAAADGYTLLAAGAPAAISQTLYPTLRGLRGDCACGERAFHTRGASIAAREKRPGANRACEVKAR